MTIDALNAFESQKAEQLGENGTFTEHAVYDPGGADVDLYGIFDKGTIRVDKGAGNVEQKKSTPRFVVSDIDFDFNIYTDKELELTHRNETYKIQEIEKDVQGAPVLWLV